MTDDTACLRTDYIPAEQKAVATDYVLRRSWYHCAKDGAADQPCKELPHLSLFPCFSLSLGRVTPDFKAKPTAPVFIRRRATPHTNSASNAAR